MEKLKRMKQAGIFLFLILTTSIVFAQQKVNIFDNAEFAVQPVALINTDASELAPFFIDELICFSAIPKKYMGKTRRMKKNTAFYSLYAAEMDENANVSSPRRPVPGFGSDIHEGPADYCAQTGEMFVTVSNVEGLDTKQELKKAKNIRLRLVIKKQVNLKWITVEELPFNDSRFHFAHPAINRTGDTLIFSSDLDSLNYGQSDLYMSIRKDGEWSDPVNLGNYINTQGNEMFPTFLPNGYLSFATDGRTIKHGGLDIYYVSFPELEEVEIFDEPINSPFDDFHLVIYPTGKSGYFTSNRSKTTSDDLYRFEVEE